MATFSASTPAARIRVWDLPLRLFHWLLVVAVALNSQPPEGTDAIGPLFEALYAAVMQ